MINLSALLIASLAGGVSLLIGSKMMDSKTSFEAKVKKRFFQTLTSMNRTPLTSTDMTFGLDKITKTDYGFYAYLIIPVGLSESDFIGIIPILENSFKSEIEYKNYYIKFISKLEGGEVYVG